MTWLDSILRKENASTGIIIQTVCPMLVKTNLIVRLNPEYSQSKIVTPQTFAKQAVRSIGLVNETTGCMFHELLYAVVYNIMPNFIVDMFISYQSKNLKEQLKSTTEKKEF
jgi:short-subunit dehydrogenase